MNASASFPLSDRFENRPFFWLVLFTVFTAFFVTNHDVTTSLSDAFTSTADEMEAAAAGGNLSRRVAFLSLAALGVLACLWTPRQRIGRLTPLGFSVLALLGWCVLSLGWSADLSTTLRRILVLGCLVTAAYGFTRQLTSRELLTIAWVVPAVGLLIGLGAELALGTFRPWVGGYRFSGTLHPNTQGLSLATMCLSVFCLARESGWQRRGYLVIFAVGLLFLVLTKSRTSLAGVLLAVTLLLTLRSPSGMKWSVALGGLWILTTAALIVLLFNIDVEDQLAQMALLGRKEQAESLTGRLPLWTFLWDFVLQRPLTGFGYDTFWTPDHIETVSSELQWGLKEAHNTYLETVLNIGLIGLILLLSVVLQALFRAREQYLKTGHPLFGFLFGMLVFGLLDGCTESGMVMPMFVPFLLGTSILQLMAVAGMVAVRDTSQQKMKQARPLPVAGTRFGGRWLPPSSAFESRGGSPL